MAAAPPVPAASTPEPASTAQPKHCPACGQRYPDDYAVCPRDATPLVREGSALDPLVGQTLGDTYEVDGVLGEGGMGRVYKARHVRLGRHFAVKVMHAHFAHDPESVARFRREATAAATVQSPYVAQVVDVNVTRDGRAFIVSELLAGEQFGAVLKRDGAMEVGRAVAIARQVSRGLSAAHAAGVVHRDLKPENVMLVRDGAGHETAKVLDFGIAKSLADDAALTRTGVVLGTPAYMAPEQARASASLDHRVDVYALGAVLYRALTGRPAFTGDDPGTTLTSVLYDEPERPKALRKDLPDGLELVVQRAMTKDPAGRYSSMAEFDAALAPFEPAASATDPRVRPPGAPALRPSGEIGGAATVAMTVDAGESVRARRARPRAVALAAFALAWGALVAAAFVGAGIEALARRPLAVVESVLAFALAGALTLPLAALWLRGMRRGAWRNTAAMLSRADDAATTLAVSLGAYALVSAAWRAVHTLFDRAGTPLRWAELAALAAALLAGGVTAALQARRRS